VSPDRPSRPYAPGFAAYLAIAGCRKRRMSVRFLGDLLPPSPPAEQASASQQQAGKSCKPRLWSPAGWSADRRGPGRFRNGRRVRKPSTNGSPSVLIEFNLPMPKPRKNGARRDSVPRRPEKESPAEAGQGTSWKENQDEAYQHQQRIAAVLSLSPSSRYRESAPTPRLVPCPKCHSNRISEIASLW